MALFAKKAAPQDIVPAATDEGWRWRGAEHLRPMLVGIEALSADDRNPRKHPERNVEAIKASLLRFGQRKPVVSRGGVVIAGNGTLVAARALGWTSLAAVDASDLTAEEARAYAIADNKTGDLAEWDFEELSRLFGEMPQELLDATGFASFEIEPLLQASWAPPPQDAGDHGDHAPMDAIRVTREQAEVIRRAVGEVRRREEQPDMSEGRALELVCADYLA